jgi:hypothetical protein
VARKINVFGNFSKWLIEQFWLAIAVLLTGAFDWQEFQKKTGSSSNIFLL